MYIIQSTNTFYIFVRYINNIPFAIVRLISDNADDDAAMTYEEIETKAAHLSAEMLFRVLEKLS